MEENNMISIENIYAEPEEYLTEIIKHEKRHYKAIKDKQFIIKLKFNTDDFLIKNSLRADLLLDKIDQGYPLVQDNNKRIMEYNYMEIAKGYAIVKVSLFSITRSHQSIPFRIIISSIPKTTNPQQELTINFSVMTDPIIVMSKLIKNKKTKEQNNQQNNNMILNNMNNNMNMNNNFNNNMNMNGNMNNNMNNNNGNMNMNFSNDNPNLEEISKNIQKMMEMLQNQSSMLQKVNSTLEMNPHQKLDEGYIPNITEEQHTKKKHKFDSSSNLDDPYYIGQEPLQASIHNLINQYKEVPCKDKKQKRLRQLLYDLHREDKNLIREFAEDVLEIFNNPVALQPNPPLTPTSNSNPFYFNSNPLFVNSLHTSSSNNVFSSNSSTAPSHSSGNNSSLDTTSHFIEDLLFNGFGSVDLNQNPTSNTFPY
eukprot:TRINITY_DN791_c0_g1_i2.p1 TRINITY_DN791_c0_g1~~TRINITY_DN791_c0_g1_i2.p1  ORF type:complete len:423 (-),score=137.77 TRINITY_DN791_c0_g1_i2:116-1384(-)